MIAARSGLLQVDIERLAKLDTEIELLNDRSAASFMHRTEIVLVTKPGATVTRGAVVACVISDESPVAGTLITKLYNLISFRGGRLITTTSDTTAALFRMVSSALKNRDFGTAEYIFSEIVSLMSAQHLFEHEHQRHSIFPAIKSEVDVVLSLERLFRESLRERDEFQIDSVRRMMISLCESASRSTTSTVIQSLMVRLELMGREFQSNGSITSVVSAWCDVGKFAFVTKSRSMSRQAVDAIASTCSGLSTNNDQGRDASFCIDRFVEMIISGMYADYWSADIVLSGAEKLAAIATGDGSPLAKYWAMMDILSLGATSLAFGRYSLALGIARLIRSAHMNFDAAVDSLRRKEIATSIQAKSDLAGEVMGEDVEAAVIRYQTWLQSLPDELFTMI